MKLRVGITGASGMIGQHLLSHWRETHTCRAYTSKSSSNPPHGEYLRSAMPEQDQLAAFVQDCDVIVHLAHKLTPAESEEHFPYALGENIGLTQKLIACLKDQSGRKAVPPLLIYLSSGGAVYGLVKPLATGIAETHLPSPISAYGIEKLTCEHLLRLGAERGLYRLVILRASNVYGAALPTMGKQGILGVWLSRIRARLPLLVTGSLATVRDYLHLDDLADAFDRLLGHSSTEEVRCFNVASSVGTSTGDVLKLLQSLTGSSTPVQTQASSYDHFSPPWNVLDCTKINRALGWTCRVQLQEGVSRFIADAHPR